MLDTLLDVVLHLDLYLNQALATVGPWIYVCLFAVIFCETGLVFMPFLPGDSLLFALGAFSAQSGSPLSIKILFISLSIAAITGDSVNYSMGKYLGRKLAQRKNSFWFKQEHLNKTQIFYQKYGGKTIILARFIPLIRTFAPFVAGMGRMDYQRFITFNISGALLWISSFLVSGYYFGNLPWIKDRMHWVIVGIIIISLLPALIESVRMKYAQQKP